MHINIYYLKENRLRGIAAWHVDDMISTGDETFYQEIIKPLMESVTFGSTAEGSYRCLGWNIKHSEGSILVSQQDYINGKIEPITVQKGQRDSQENLSENESSEVTASIGKLRWLGDQTRPDIAYDLLELSMAAHSPKVEILNKINKTVTAITSRPIELRYDKLEGDKWFITVTQPDWKAS